jgi:hypothetical protein
VFFTFLIVTNNVNCSEHYFTELINKRNDELNSISLDFIQINKIFGKEITNIGNLKFSFKNYWQRTAQKDSKIRRELSHIKW